MKLEPTEAQRKAMAEVGASGPTAGWSDRVNDWFPVVHRMIAAANSIPEGAPVGTIARRPDGAWKAERKAGEAGPYWQYSTSAFWQADSPDWNSEDDADSWPVIYDPDEYHEGDKPRLERLMREPSRFDADSTAQQEPCCGVSEVYDCDCPPAIRITPKPRTPRVVDRLGVDEQGSRWHGAEGAAVYFHSGESWRTNQGNVFAAGYQPNWNAPYTEILEPQPEAEGESSPKSSPRVLPSLDCEEARDGTAWQAAFSNTVHRRGWKFWYVPAEREWHTDGGYDRSGPLNTLDFLTERGPYTEVLGDPS